jgi:4-amino-4-deoxy-L-arabinose transferase-like glycosyltransferase
VGAIVALSLVVRGVAIWLYGPTTVRFGDALSYVEAAQALCADGSYPWRSNLPFFRAPGLPFFLAIATLCHPGDIAAAKAALAVLDAGTVVLTYALARAIRLAQAPALLAAALVAVNPFVVQSSVDVTTEPLATLLIAAWLTAIVRGAGPGRGTNAWTWAIAGVAAGLAALTRPAALVCVPLGVVGAFLLVDRGAGARRVAIARAAVLSVAALLVLAPWSIAASRAAGGPILVNDAGGYALWRGVHRDLARAAAAPDAATFLAESERFERETSPRVAAEVDARFATPSARAAEWRRLAIAEVRADPGTAASFLVRKARVYWRPWVDRSVSPTWLVVASALVSLPVLAGGIAGLAWLGRRTTTRSRVRPRSQPALAIFLALVIATPWLAQLPYQVMSRFRVPFVEVPASVLASGLACAILSRWRAGRRVPPRSDPDF